MTLSPGQVLARVEGELQAFWSSPPAPGETPKARACTRNLVVVAGTPEVAERWLPTVDDVLQAIPARAIVVGLDPGRRRMGSRRARPPSARPAKAAARRSVRSG